MEIKVIQFIEAVTVSSPTGTSVTKLIVMKDKPGLTCEISGNFIRLSDSHATRLIPLSNVKEIEVVEAPKKAK